MSNRVLSSSNKKQPYIYRLKTTFLGKQNSGFEPIFLQNKWIFLKIQHYVFTKRSQGKSCHLEMLLGKWNADDGDE